MKKEKNNFARAVEWLKTNGVIKDQKDMSERMGVSENTISRNKHGSVKRPDDDTLKRFSEQFGDIINVAYLRGESKVMLMKNIVERRSVKKNDSTDKTALLAAKDETIAAKNEIIAGLRSQLATVSTDRDAIVAAKDELIASLQQQVSDLRRQTDELRLQATLEKGLPTAGTCRSVAAKPTGSPLRDIAK